MSRSEIARRSAITILGTAFIMFSGCGGAKPATETPPAASPAAPSTPQTPAEAAQQAAQGLQQMAQQTQSAPAVDFEKLVALIPEQSGWTRTAPKGQQVSMGVSISRAEAQYSKDDSSLNLDITDTAFSQVVMAPLSMMLMTTYSERSTEGYKKYAAIGGSPGFETWENGPKEGEVTAVVASRFIVHARGTNVPNIDPVKAVVMAVDFGKLATLK